MAEHRESDTHEQRQAAYLPEVRAKYPQDEVDELGKKGHAFGPDDGGHYSYPIDDEADLDSAIHAVGRGSADHDDIRKYIIGRAKAMGLSSKIPDNWKSDGSLDESKSAPVGPAATRSLEWRKTKAKEMRGHHAERRTFHLQKIELRKADDGALHLSGYASVTETPYDMGWYTESIKRGAFGKTLAENPDVQLLVNHEGLPLARTGVNMDLSEDNTGLRVEADLDPDDPDVQRLAPKIGAGLVDQMSFAFQVNRQEWSDDYTERIVTEANIHRGDVSVVNQGANPSTSVSVRSEDAVLALRRMGPEVVAEAFLELRRYSGTAKEQRLGMTLSAATTEVLTQVLNLCAAADEAMDEAQPLLADLMGVDNPDEDSGSGDDDTKNAGTEAETGTDSEALSMPPPVLDFHAERARLEAKRYPPRRAS